MSTFSAAKTPRRSVTARRRSRPPVICRSRDPDSNQGHHDFQSVHGGGRSARNSSKHRVPQLWGSGCRCSQIACFSGWFGGWTGAYPLIAVVARGSAKPPSETAAFYISRDRRNHPLRRINPVVRRPLRARRAEGAEARLSRAHAGYVTTARTPIAGDVAASRGRTVVRARARASAGCRVCRAGAGGDG